MDDRIKLADLSFNHPRAGATVASLYMSTYTTAIGTPALFLRDPETDEPLWVLSSNMVDYGVEPDEFCTYFKGYAENEGLLEILVATGIIECTGRCVKMTHVSFPEVKINATPEAWEEFRLLCHRAANPNESEPNNEI